MLLLDQVAVPCVRFAQPVSRCPDGGDLHQAHETDEHIVYLG